MLRGPADAGRNDLVKAGPAAPTLTEIAARESEFLWLTLQRMGVRREDCPDVLQNVLVVVHKKHSSYDPSQPLRAWLYGIARHVCARRMFSGLAPTLLIGPRALLFSRGAPLIDFAECV